MGKSTFEGLAVAVADYEENYLQSVDTQPTKIMSIAQLVHEAGGKCVRAVLPSAFEDADELEGDSTFYQDEVNAWKQDNNRQNLPVMRVKVTVEVCAGVAVTPAPTVYLTSTSVIVVPTFTLTP